MLDVFIDTNILLTFYSFKEEHLDKLKSIVHSPLLLYFYSLGKPKPRLAKTFFSTSSEPPARVYPGEQRYELHAWPFMDTHGDSALSNDGSPIILVAVLANLVQKAVAYAFAMAASTLGTLPCVSTHATR